MDLHMKFGSISNLTFLNNVFEDFMIS